MPLFWAKKEVFEWLRSGQKTIDVRKGQPHNGVEAVFQCGPCVLRLRIVCKEVGKLAEVVRLDNFKRVIPVAGSLEEAIEYFCGLYGDCEGVFTAYYVESPQVCV
jgi:ASC-1-like (ASCH) protein